MIVHKGQEWLTINEFAAAHGRSAAYAKHQATALRKEMPKTDTLHLKIKGGDAGYPNQYWYRKGAAWPRTMAGRPRAAGIK